MANDYWRTPQSVIEYVEKRFGNIGVDLCASQMNHVGDGASYFTEENSMLTASLVELENALENGGTYEDCSKIFYCNPPYSNPLPFVKACIQICLTTRVDVVMLLNQDTSTKWFMKINNNAAGIYPIVGGRIAFLDENGKPVKGNNKPQLLVKFSPYGKQHWETIHIEEVQPKC